jgi:hypothetical protein
MVKWKLRYNFLVKKGKKPITAAFCLSSPLSTGQAGKAKICFLS